MNKVNFIITHKCNLMCKHCYMNAGNSCNENNDLIFKRFKDAIVGVKELGINEIMITGGECSISPILLEILEFCKNINIKTSIFTNGILFNDRILEYVDDYCLSLDGLKDNHNALRGSLYAYDNTIKTIKKLKKSKKNISIQITVTNRNIDELLELIKEIYPLGINKINICCLLDEGRSLDNNLSSDIELKKLDKIVKKAYQETGYNIKIHTNVFQRFDTNVYLKNNAIIFPLWIDLVNNSFYLVKDDSIFSLTLDEFSKENVEILNNKINNYISSNLDKFLSKDQYVLENMIITEVRGKENNE